ncbi:MAG TPA: hypothetical protein IGS52_13950 [Oscillatoriaceae cyanobacterium M33_DOE_052]|uniref:Uncharacterized protein n=1 Tax=Planktothricoides sp. SpSt-374 TaxID=2282167 RepID=A0A7C3ZMK1_9CYAN|nr:hypothetical protein [Oscillatoriaceae cyanobacterium M33_DOE_052]
MERRPEKDVVFTEFRQECSIRRTAKVLDGKRKRIREDIQYLIAHMALLVPPVAGGETDISTQIITEALGRLGDDAFAQLVLQIMQELK